jgi:hypothetical protein
MFAFLNANSDNSSRKTAVIFTGTIGRRCPGCSDEFCWKTPSIKEREANNSRKELIIFTRLCVING